MMFSFWGSQFLLEAGLAVAIMWVLWFIQMRTKNAGIMDVGWAILIVLLAVLDAIWGIGWLPRKMICASMATIWGFRLAFTLFFKRIYRHIEDGRYQKLRVEWKEDWDNQFLLFFQLKGFQSLIFSMPFIISCSNKAKELSLLEKFGIFLWLASFCGEILADYQLDHFKSNPLHRGKTCRVGLWKFSRHPNYFSEWLLCCSFALFTLASPYGYIALISPMLVLYFLMKRGELPLCEDQALQAQGEDYRRYQKTTSAFMPWFERPTRD